MSAVAGTTAEPGQAGQGPGRPPENTEPPGPATPPDPARPTPASPSVSPLRLLLARVRPHRGVLIRAGLLSLAGSGAGLAMPLMAKHAVDTFADGRSPVAPLVALTALVLAGACLSAYGSFLMSRTGEGVVLRARDQLVGRIMRLKVPAVDRLTPGDLQSRVTSDTTLLRTVLSSGLVESFNSVLMLLGTIALMAYMDLTLLGVTLVVVVGIGAVTSLLMPRIQRAQLKAQESVGAMGAALDRVLQAFRTVKASGAEERETAAVAAAARHAHDRGVTVAKWSSVTEVTMTMSIQLAFLAVLGVGGARVASGSLEISSLIAFLLYLFYLMGPIGGLVEGWTGLQSGLAAVRRIDEVVSLPGEPAQESSGLTKRNGGPLGVTFQDVTFGYGDERAPAHQGVTFDVPTGGMVALVGPSGAGKSTVFSLLERFYDHEAGTITVGGRDIRDWPLAELRGSLAYVEQDAPVLAGTLRENLLFAAPDADEKELASAVTRTRLDALVERLPEGLDTAVGHRGVTLSGGERQRIAIARALLRHPRLLLLDEVTSQLDAVNEQALRDVILELAERTTVLVIAHRLSTVRHADRIVVLEEGRVRTAGTHEELIAGDELYRELATTQLAADGEGA
ncbi:ABC transporter ATP-binding protein [Streptomyces griseus]|nr:ABC transporter ATP-binding protein [Streptomyces globisporus]AWL86999.1 ABC transporter ATP-binding protein [Streptomyces globisporus]PPA40847.1 ABC transporter ATP-binding protein [Streptomyces griseus]RAN18190.1 ABC transporter ATP-binding protein [Streptomyces badius]RAN26071.1 ABC transporter ATP-binding protein [Streptomyces badius]